MSRPGALTGIERITDPAVRRALQAIVEAIEFREGRRPRQNPLDRFVTARELRGQSERDINEAVRRAGGASAGGGADELDLTPPPGPTGLVASPGVGQVILVWNSPWEAYDNHSLTEVWRADVDDIGQAVLVDRASGRVWVDEDVPEGATRYYWIRFVSAADVTGAFNATAGTSATTVRAAETVRDALTASEWAANTAYTAFAVVAPSAAYRIGDVEARFQATDAGTSGATEPDWTQALAFGDTVSDGTVTWQAVEVGKVPFITGEIGGVPVVFMHGAAMLQASIRDAAIENLNAAKLFAATGTLAEAIIGDAEITNAMIGNLIQSSNFQSGVSGWRLPKDATAELVDVLIRGNATVRGDVEATSLKANSASIVDTIHIANQAVTILTDFDISPWQPSFDVASPQLVTLGEVSWSSDAGNPVLIFGNFKIGAYSGDARETKIGLRVEFNGALLYPVATTFMEYDDPLFDYSRNITRGLEAANTTSDVWFYAYPSFAAQVVSASGTNTVRVRAYYMGNGQGVDYVYAEGSVANFEAKR
jgi:hypothetical protein